MKLAIRTHKHILQDDRPSARLLAVELYREYLITGVYKKPKDIDYTKL